MTRDDLKSLADIRVADAEALLRVQRWPAAYYLLAYAIECALKACAARQFREHEVPDRKFVNDFYVHRLEELLNLSGLKSAVDVRAKADPLFLTKWSAVRDWRETSRHDPSISEAKARDLHSAVTDANYGVLPCLKTQW